MRVLIIDDLRPAVVTAVVRIVVVDPIRPCPKLQAPQQRCHMRRMLRDVPIEHRLKLLRGEMVAHLSAGIIVPVMRAQLWSVALQHGATTSYAVIPRTMSPATPEPGCKVLRESPADR